MNPTSNETNGLKLPTPVTEQTPITGISTEQAVPSVPELAPNAFEQNPNGASIAAQPLPSIPLPQPAQSASTDVPLPTSSATIVPDVADDGDLIEKEWVNKAKQIVEKTRDDPYMQSKEMTLFKADYMKKRYNKSIKLSE